MTITVVCTDRGQHNTVKLGTLDAWPDGNGWSTEPHLADDYWFNTAPIDAIGAALDQGLGSAELLERARAMNAAAPHKTFKPKCVRCGRYWPLRVETLDRLGAAAAVAGVRTVDLSKLL